MDAVLRDNYLFRQRYNRCIGQRPYQACGPLTDAKRKQQREAFFSSLHQMLTHLL